MVPSEKVATTSMLEAMICSSSWALPSLMRSAAFSGQEVSAVAGDERGDAGGNRVDGDAEPEAAGDCAEIQARRVFI